MTRTVAFLVNKEDFFGDVGVKKYSYLQKSGEPIKSTKIWVGKFLPLSLNRNRYDTK